MSSAWPALTLILGLALLEVLSIEVASTAAAEPGRPDHVAIERSVGRIFCTLDGRRSMGTGFVLDEGGHIMTSRHVVHPGARPCDRLEIAFDRSERHPLRYVGGDPERDLAIVAVDRPTPPPLPLGPAPRKGDAVWATGFPLSPGVRLTRQWRYTDPNLVDGRVSAYPIEGGVQRLVIAGSDAMPGHSGSPVYDACGRVVGVMRVRVEAGRAVAGYAVPPSEIERFLRSQLAEPRRQSTCLPPTHASARQISTLGLLDQTGRAAESDAGPAGHSSAMAWVGDVVEPWHLAVGAALVLGVVVGRRRRPTARAERPTPPPSSEPRSADIVTRLIPPREASASGPVLETRLSTWWVRFVAGPRAGTREELDGVFRLGRDPDFSTVPLPPDTPGVSRAHIEISLDGGAPALRDVGSTAGTRIDGTPIERHRWVPLTEGALVELGGGISLVLEVS